MLRYRLLGYACVERSICPNEVQYLRGLIVNFSSPIFSSVFRTGLVLLLFHTSISAQVVKPRLLEVQRIWDAAPHNAFTDLVRWNDRFYCAFREGQGHAGDIGKLRIITSTLGDRWESAGLLSMENYDLRDAALSVMPDGRLMILGGAQQIVDGKHVTGTFVSFTSDGREFTDPKIVVPAGRWLWRVTWHGDTAYGVSYGNQENQPFSALHKTTDGVHYESVTKELLGE